MSVALVADPDLRERVRCVRILARQTPLSAMGAASWDEMLAQGETTPFTLGYDSEPPAYANSRVMVQWSPSPIGAMPTHNLQVVESQLERSADAPTLMRIRGSVQNLNPGPVTNARIFAFDLTAAR